MLDAETFTLEKILSKPYVKLLKEDYNYLPNRLAVDLAGRIYVIATDINDGILLLDENGEFVRFAGVPDVTMNLWTKFLKLFMTKAQKANLEKSVSTEYSSFLMDENGFLYLTSSDSTVHPITKLNSQGTDILKYDSGGYPDGDSSHVLKKSAKNVSTFVNISVREDGIYASLDTTKGRLVHRLLAVKAIGFRFIKWCCTAIKALRARPQTSARMYKSPCCNPLKAARDCISAVIRIKMYP